MANVQVRPFPPEIPFIIDMLQDRRVGCGSAARDFCKECISRLPEMADPKRWRRKDENVIALGDGKYRVVLESGIRGVATRVDGKWSFEAQLPFAARERMERAVAHYVELQAEDESA